MRCWLSAVLGLAILTGFSVPAFTRVGRLSVALDQASHLALG